MSLLSNLVLNIKGFFNSKGNSLIDLRYAGEQKIRETESKIAEVQVQLDSLIGRKILIDRDITKKQELVQQYEQAVKDHHSIGNVALQQKAYEHYQTEQKDLDQLFLDQTDLEIQIKSLKAQIQKIESTKNQVKNDIVKAANTQVVGKAINQVEDIHTELTKGSLHEVIEQSNLNAAIGEGKRQQREEQDGSAILEYQKESNLKTLDQILGK